MNYKEAHEQFVSNHGGTSVGEIALVVSVAPITLLLRNVVLHSVFAQSLVKRKCTKLQLDVVLLVLPLLLSFTVCADHVQALITGLLTATLGVILFNESVQSSKCQRPSFSSILDDDLPGEKRPFISAYRAYVNIATAISILAVDFAIYPRRFAKAETYGTGLMDVGVGAFIISNAIVSPESRKKGAELRSVADKVKSVFKACKGCLPLIVLGLIRLISVKSTGYQEHVTEYGVHWNFFFTLAYVKILSTIILCFVSPSASALLSLVFAVGYETALTKWRLKDSILSGFGSHDSREGFLNANREGIFSAIGYLSLYFAGIVIGKYLFQARSSLKQWITCLFTLGVSCQGFYLLLFYSETFVDNVSRRLANLSFIIWMVAYNLQTLTSFCLVDVAVYVCQRFNYLKRVTQKDTFVEESRCLLEAINRNGLLYFLLANLLTGVVNFSMSTIYATPPVGFCVVLVYMTVLSAIVYCMHLKNITTRFW